MYFLLIYIYHFWGFPGVSDSKESTCNAGDQGSISGLGRSLRREWLPIPIFLPGESHKQSSLVGYSPWGRKELDTNEWLTYTHTTFKWLHHDVIFWLYLISVVLKISFSTTPVKAKSTFFFNCITFETGHFFFFL